MITIFRKIRKKMADDNRPLQYIRYAIGEIVLVMIGILLALQVSDWNETRLKSNKEAIVLANIHKEFLANKAQLETVIQYHELVQESCGKIISYFPIRSKPEPEVLDSLSKYLWYSYGGYTFDPSQSSINALMSSSSFDIISNEDLRNLLISWNDLVKDYQEEEVNSRNYVWDQYDPYLSKNFDFKFNFNDPRNHFEELQSLEFEYKVKTRRDLVNKILEISGELKKLQETLDTIIAYSDSSYKSLK